MPKNTELTEEEKAMLEEIKRGTETVIRLIVLFAALFLVGLGALVLWQGFWINS